MNQFQNNHLSPVLRTAELMDPDAALRRPGRRSDLDGDGKSDILWRNEKTGAVQWWRMDGLRTRDSARIRKGSDFSLASVGDIDGDGRADLAGAKERATTLWQMKGASALDKQSVTVYYAGQRPLLADLNGDDRVEGLWLDNGKSPNIQQPRSIYDWSLDPEIQGSVVGDFDGDRRSDLVLSDSRDGSTAIWYMMGTRWLTTKTVLTMNAKLRAVAAADFDGDGKTDLLMANKANGSVAMWLMDGSRIKSKRTLLNLSDWAFAASPDLNGDGKSDIVWHSARRGSSVAWLMNGPDVKASKTLRTNSDWTPVGP